MSQPDNLSTEIALSMNILMLSTRHKRGGAAVAASRLQEALRAQGHDATLLVRDLDCPDPGVRDARRECGIKERYRRAFNRLRNENDLNRYPALKREGQEKFSHFRGRFDVSGHELLESADVVNLHWIADFVMLENLLNRIPGTTPVVWTLHDANPFTGGCHFTQGCRKFQNGCTACPQLDSSDEGDLTSDGNSYKRRALSALDDGQLHVVAPSQWIGRESGDSALLGHVPHTVIPYGLDLRRFHPIDKRHARESYGIEEGRPTVLALVESLENQRKGLDLLIEALHLIPAERRPLLLLAGEGSVPAGDVEVMGLGILTGEDALARAYCSADLHVVPSREDNLPNTVLESLACGTPVVAFDIGGMSDMITPEETGLLAAPGDTGDLADCIGKMLENPELDKSIRRACRDDAERRFGSELQAHRYAELFTRLSHASKQGRNPSP